MGVEEDDVEPDYDVIVQEFDGGTVVEGNRGDGVLAQPPFRVVSPHDEKIHVFGGYRWTAQKKAEVMARLVHLAEGVEIVDEGAVPVDIAVLGKPAIAGYLYAAHDLHWERSNPNIAQVMGIDPEAARQYVNKFRRGDR